MTAYDPEVVYRRLVEHMNEAVWMGDAKERTIYANPKFCKMVEYELPEIMGKESYMFWDEESSKRVRNVNMTDRKQGISSSYQGIIMTKSGKKVPVLLSGTPLPDGGTIGIMTDLSELKKRESMYKKLVEHMNEAVWMGDSKERTIYANPKFCDLLGYTLEEMMGKESYMFWDGESAQRVRQVNTLDRKHGHSSSYEGNLLTKDGRRIPVLLSGTPLPGGGTIGIMTNLSELKEKEATERLLSSAIEHANDAIVIMDHKGKIESWNQGAKVMFGYRKEEVINTSIHSVFPAHEIEHLLRESSIRQNIELVGKHKNARSVSVSATFTCIYPEGKSAPPAWLMIARDITMQAKFEEELSLRYQKLREAYNQFGIVRRQMDYAFELIELCSAQHNAQWIGDFIVNSVIMLTRVDACVLRIYEKKKGMLQLLSCFGLASDWWGKSSVRYKGSLLEEAFEQRLPLKIIDLMKEPKYKSKQLASKNNLTSMLVIPLLYQSELVGSLSLYVGSGKKLEIFENDYIERYAQLIGLVLARCLK